MSCYGLMSAHDPRTPVNRYVLLTRSGPRTVELCHGCAGSLDRIGAAIRPERRAVEREAWTEPELRIACGNR